MTDVSTMPEGQAVHSVSVVIPVRDEASSLPGLLESLARQTLAPAEIVVVDGGSSDGTADGARALAETDRRIRLIEAGSATPGRGRNVGLEAASHEWVALTDAGAWVEPQWLQELVGAAERHPEAVVVYGNFEPIIDTFFTRCAALAYVPPKRATAAGLLRGPSTISMLLRRDVWKLVGGFPDLRAGEDLIFMERVANHALHVAWAPAATVWWHLQPSLASTFRRFVIYSRHNVLAGLQRRWHYAVARQYVIAIVFIALAWGDDWRWLFVLPAGLALRTAKSLWHRRGLSSARWQAWDPVQFLGVLGVLVALDAATFVGWIQAIVGNAFGDDQPA